MRQVDYNGLAIAAASVCARTIMYTHGFPETGEVGTGVWTDVLESTLLCWTKSEK